MRLFLSTVLMLSATASLAAVDPRPSNPTGISPCWDQDPATTLVVAFDDGGGRFTIKIGTRADANSRIELSSFPGATKSAAGVFTAGNVVYNPDSSGAHIIAPSLKLNKDLGICFGPQVFPNTNSPTGSELF